VAGWLGSWAGLVEKQLHVGKWQEEVCQPHASTSICWKDCYGELGTGIAAYSLTCISLLELVLSGKLLYLTTFSSRAAKMKKMNRPKFASAKPTENKKKVA